VSTTPQALSDPSDASASQKPRGGVIDLDPMTRVGGALGVRVTTDGTRITDAHAAGNFFRGYETLALKRDLRDVMPIVSRACGWCGGAHMTTASLALEMAFEMRPPPMAIGMRTIAQATEAIWVHAAHLAVRAAPDYCASVVAKTTPRLWAKARVAKAPGASIHGYGTIADLMEGMTPLTGRYWTETLPAGRRVQEMISMFYGKFPHPSVAAPGTVAATLSWATFTEYFTRLVASVDYVKQVCALWDDLIAFLYEADERFLTLGQRPASFIHAGCWDDVRSAYTYEGLDENGRARLAPPGVMIDGNIETRNLSEVHAHITEHVDHSFYDTEVEGGHDRRGDSLPDGHPWTQRNIARPAQRDEQGAYSWCAAPRWGGHVVESTPLGRLWLTATRDDFPTNDFIEATGSSIRILVPMNFQPETIVEWKIPERVNALERLRADAYGIAFAGLCAAITLLKGFELMRTGEMEQSIPLDIPEDETMGVGLWETGRGFNAHWLRGDAGRVTNYQIISASTLNASPRDADGRPGPMEEALIDSPIIEESSGDELTGIDAMRVIHSFDPCMNCANH